MSIAMQEGRMYTDDMREADTRLLIEQVEMTRLKRWIRALVYGKCPAVPDGQMSKEQLRVLFSPEK
jgi:hypothetical protein